MRVGEDFVEEFELQGDENLPGVGSREVDREWETVVADGGCACTSGGPLEGSVAAMGLLGLLGFRRRQS